MKNIYEDSTNRSDAEDIMSNSADGKAENSGNSSFESKKTEIPAAQMPALQLTPEQISALVAQLVSARPDIVSDLITTPKQQPAEEKKPEPKTYSRTDPGKKVLFQSDDFEESSSETELDEFSGDDEPEDKFVPMFSSEETEERKPSMNFSKKPEPGFFEADIDEEEAEFFSPKKSTAARKNFAPSVPSGSSISVDDFEEDEFAPSKKKLGKSQIIRLTVVAVAILAIVISGAVLLNEYRLSKENKEYEAAVSDLIVDVPETTGSSKENEEENENVALSIEQQWNEIRAQYPNVIFPPKIQLKYAKLYAANSDFAGYLSADEIGLNLPVVQTSDDETYLNKNFYGQTTKYGCPFVSYLNNITELDQNTVIFGHHMNDKTIFGALDAYKTIEGYKKAPVITFNTLYNDYKWKVVSAFITNSDLKDDDSYVFQYYFTNLRSKDNLAGFLDELSKRSLYDTGVDVNTSDKLLTLSTCSHEFDDARFVVVARLVRAGESESVNTDNVVENNNPRYPQAYYSKLKKENPYKNVEKWYIQ